MKVTEVRNLVLAAAAAFSLGGCLAATIPLNMIATNVITDNMMTKAEQIPNMNCTQLKKRWSELKGPGALMSPFRSAGAERSLVRQYAGQRGCRLPA